MSSPLQQQATTSATTHIFYQHLTAMGKGGRVRVKQVGGGGGAKMPMNPLADLMGGILPEDEMIQLPPNRDSNSGFMIWPMSK